MSPTPERKILVVPNEDGFGPSSLVSHIAKELLRRPEVRCILAIWNKSRLDYNRSLYMRHEGRVSFAPVWNIIQLSKDSGGQVSIPETLRTIGDYRSASDQFGADVAVGSFDLVLDFGVPAAVRRALHVGSESVSVFDHAWGKTLGMIFDDQHKLHDNRRQVLESREGEWRGLATEIASDERLTKRLFVFPPFITPALFYDYWRHELRVSPWDIGAVLGGRPVHSAQDARRFLQLTEPGDAILIQGGDTPVWDSALKKVVPAFVEAERSGNLEKKKLNVVIYLPGRLVANPAIKQIDDPGLKRVRKLVLVPGGTIQEILPAIDFLVTRAGGGSVNDAVACRVPFVCVREPTQSQVEEILKTCLDEKLTRAIEPDDFERHPTEVILDHYAMREANRDIVGRMRMLPCQGERIVAEAVLQLLRVE